MSLSAEHHYAAGFRASAPSEAVASLRRATRLFPLDHDMRTAVADYCDAVRWSGSLPICIQAAERALAVDPNDADMHRRLAGLLVEAGDTAAVEREMRIVKRLAPMAVQVGLKINMNPGLR